MDNQQNQSQPENNQRTNQDTAQDWRDQAGQPFQMGRRLSAAELEAILAKDYKLDPVDCIKEGIEIWKKNIGWYIGYLALVGIISMALSFIPFLGSIASPVIYMPLFAGIYLVVFKILKNQEIVFNDFFKGFHYFLPLLLSSLVTSVLTVIGFILLIIPGIYLLVAYIFANLIIIDLKIDFWQAMELSRKMVSKNWFSLAFLLLLLAILNAAGFICLIIGLLITVPITMCALAVAYQKIFGIESRVY